jgi:hypothetical protein
MTEAPPGPIRTHAEMIADLVRQELDLFGFSNIPVQRSQIPDDGAEMAVSVTPRGGAASDLAAQYDNPSFVIRARAKEPLVAELLAQLLHLRLHRRGYMIDQESGRVVWSLRATASPQLDAVLGKRPRYEWAFELQSMMER